MASNPSDSTPPTDRPPSQWTSILSFLFVLGFLGGLSGIVWGPSDRTVALTTVFTICAGGSLLVLFADRIVSFKLGPGGVEATLKEIKDKVETLTKLQELQLAMHVQINQDLLARRFTAYGDLWNSTHPTALFGTDPFGPKHVTDLTDDLKKWYFTPTGGLLLTQRSRGFYFALQDLLRKLGEAKLNWQCVSRPPDAKSKFANLLQKVDVPAVVAALKAVRKEESGQDDPTDHGELAAKIVAEVKRIQTTPEELDPQVWRAVCRWLGDDLSKTPGVSGEDIYAAIQQVSSVLRTNLTHELRSRFDVDWPTEIAKVLKSASPLSEKP